QDRLHSRAKPAAHQAEMAAVRAREQLGDGVSLAVPLHTKHDGIVGPLHYAAILWESFKSTAIRGVRRLFLRKFQPHRAIALGVLAPALAHLHEQEQVHLGLGCLGYVLARRRADRLDALATFAEHDFALALALDVDRLLDPYLAVAQLLPLLGFHRGLVWQFLM